MNNTTKAALAIAAFMGYLVASIWAFTWMYWNWLEDGYGLAFTATFAIHYLTVGMVLHFLADAKPEIPESNGKPIE